MLVTSPALNYSFFPRLTGAEQRVQDNFHAHAQNAIPPPKKKSGEKPYLEVLSRFGLWRDFLNNNIQATISAFRLLKNMSIN